MKQKIKNLCIKIFHKCPHFMRRFLQKFASIIMSLELPTKKNVYPAVPIQNKPRIAILTNSFISYDGKKFLGGAERLLWHFIPLLQRHGFDVRIYLTHGTALSMLVSEPDKNHIGYSKDLLWSYEGFEICIPAVSEWYNYENPGDYEEWNRLVLEHSKDCSHYMYFSPHMIPKNYERKDSLALAHMVWDTNKVSSYIGSMMSNYLFNNTHCVSVDVNFISALNTLFGALPMQHHKKVKHIPNFADIKFFYPDENKRNKDTLTVLIPRRADETRGVYLMEEILKKIPHKNVCFYWVGGGEEKAMKCLENLAEQDNRFHFIPFVPFDEMPDWYKKADITMIPTISTEGGSLVALEACASGSAVVTTYVGGLPHEVFNLYNGLAVAPYAEELADALNILIENKELREKIQKNALEYSQNFSLEVWEHRWIEYLKKIGWI